MTAADPSVIVLCADVLMRDRVSYWLNSAGILTDVASDGYSARNLLVGVSPKLLVTDRLLPPWPGLDTVFNLRRTAAPLLTVVFLDSGTPGSGALARLAGADVVLAWPPSRASLFAAHAALGTRPLRGRAA